MNYREMDEALRLDEEYAAAAADSDFFGSSSTSFPIGSGRPRNTYPTYGSNRSYDSYGSRNSRTNFSQGFSPAKISLQFSESVLNSAAKAVEPLVEKKRKKRSKKAKAQKKPKLSRREAAGFRLDDARSIREANPFYTRVATGTIASQGGGATIQWGGASSR